MNGRAYDYNLGRFLSVDPFIQSPGNSQGMNAYSYIMNSPFAGTDPSGYNIKSDTRNGNVNPIHEAITGDDIASIKPNADGSVSATLNDGSTHMVPGVTGSTSGGVTTLTFSNGGGGSNSISIAGGIDATAVGGFQENSTIKDFSSAGQGDNVDINAASSNQKNSQIRQCKSYSGGSKCNSQSAFNNAAKNPVGKGRADSQNMALVVLVKSNRTLFLGNFHS